METCEYCPLLDVSDGVNSIAFLLVTRSLVRRGKVTLQELESDGLSNEQVLAIGDCLDAQKSGKCQIGEVD